MKVFVQFEGLEVAPDLTGKHADHLGLRLVPGLEQGPEQRPRVCPLPVPLASAPPSGRLFLAFPGVCVTELSIRQRGVVFP